MSESMRQLLGSLVAGAVPPTLVRPLPRIEEGAYPQRFALDDDGYPFPSELDLIRMVCARDAERWAREVMPQAWDSLLGPYRHCVADDPHWEDKLRITYDTGGWSGLESFMDAVMANFWLRRLCVEQGLGGHFVFRVTRSSKVESC